MIQKSSLKELNQTIGHDCFIQQHLGEQQVQSQATYIEEWNYVFSDIMNDHYKNPDANFLNAAQFLFGNPSTMEELATEALNMLPPLRHAIEIRKMKKKGELELLITTKSDELLNTQIELHMQHIQSEDSQNLPTILDTSKNDSINSSLQGQVREIDEKLDRFTNDIKLYFTTMEKKLTLDISQSVKNAFQNILQSSQEETQKLHETIIEGKRTSEKLTGALNTTTVQLSQLQNQAQSLTTNMQSASEKATKAYLEAKAEMDTAKHDIDLELEKALGTIKSKVIDTQDEGSLKKNKYYDNEYRVNGQLITICAKKFNDDKTLISCKGQNMLLGTYNTLRHVANQYDIKLQTLGNMTKWIKEKNQHPPTFPLQRMDFDTSELYKKAYTTMSMAFATKLKTGINFDKHYVAPKMAIFEYQTDGYVMLYNLLKTVHPKLLQDKASKPKKPAFDGNINRFFSTYENWLQFQLQRSQPHVYDDDKIADDIIDTIKSSKYGNKLKEGLEPVEIELCQWKSMPTDPFPVKLQLDSLAQTIMSYYIQHNLDPLSTFSDSNPSIRQMYTRGRSRSNSRTCDNTKQNYPADFVDCKICGMRHKTTTAGCPNLFTQVKVQEYINSQGSDKINREVESIGKERSRSHSHSNSQSSRRSQQSRCSNN
jgi:hypothetical protein